MYLKIWLCKGWKNLNSSAIPAGMLEFHWNPGQFQFHFSGIQWNSCIPAGICRASKSTVQNYNIADQALIPPWATLSWDNIMEYAFLSDFDLLSDMHSDVHLKIWAKPASWVLMDQHFKMEQAREEVARFNIEIPQLTTYIHDKEAFLLQHKESLQETDPPLSCQLCLHCLKLIWSNNLHLHWLEKLAILPGFCGTIAPGTVLDAVTEWADNLNRPTPQDPEHTEGEEEEGGEEEEHAAAEAADAFCLVIEGSHLYLRSILLYSFIQIYGDFYGI